MMQVEAIAKQRDETQQRNLSGLEYRMLYQNEINFTNI